MNSLYDTDYNATGHQPYMFDQLTQLYKEYRVHWMKWTVSIDWLDSSTKTNDTYCVVNVRADTDGGDAVSTLLYDSLAERPGCIVKHLNPTTGRPCVFSGVTSMHKVLGMTKAEYRQEAVSSAAYTTNPGRLVWLEVGILTKFSITSTPPTVQIRVAFTFGAEMDGYSGPVIS